MVSSLKGAEVDGTDLKLGQRVLHSKFGEGMVVNYEGAVQHQPGYNDVGNADLDDVSSF